MSKYFVAIKKPIRLAVRQSCRTSDGLYRMLHFHKTPVVPRCPAKRIFFSSQHLCHPCPTRRARCRNPVGSAVPTGPSESTKTRPRPFAPGIRNHPPKSPAISHISQKFFSQHFAENRFGLGGLVAKRLGKTPSFLRFYTFFTFNFIAFALPGVGKTVSLQESPKEGSAAGFSLKRRTK